MYLVLGCQGKTGQSICKFLEKGSFWVYDDALTHHPLMFPSLKYLQTHVKAIIKSPGVSLDHWIIKVAPKIPVINDFDFFKPTAKVIGVTGTNGKSTFTELLAHILRTCGFEAVAGGNLGTPVLDLPKVNDFYVLELSSYQLETNPNLVLDAAILLNITPDHLARHGSYDNYKKAKYNIFNHAKQAFIAADIDVHPGCSHMFEEPSRLLNACLNHFGVDDLTIEKAIQTFKSLPHRLEDLGAYNDITYINDSKATNAEATSYGLAKMNTRNIHLILGGCLKNDNLLDEIRPHLQKIKHIYLIGEDMSTWENLLLLPNMTKCHTLEKAFEAIQTKAHPGDTVLLAPAGASLDQYRNFEERGNEFKKLVQNLKSRK